MDTFKFISLIFLMSLVFDFSFARGRGGSHHSHGSSRSHSSKSWKPPKMKASYQHFTPTHYSKSYAPGVKRDKHGKIARSSSARTAFKKAHPCPSTGKSTDPCKGYVIDHIKPLKRGGVDGPGNMQWQTKEAAHAKDKWE